MALTADVIKANEALKELDDSVITAIVTLSTNDEATVVAAKEKEIYKAVATDAAQEIGVQLPGTADPKSWLSTSVFKAAKGSVDLTAKITAHEATIADLNKKLKDGSGDEQLKQQLTDTEARLAQLQGLYDTEKTDWENKLTESEKKAFDIRVDNEFSGSLNGLEFKKEIPEGVRKSYIENVKSSILAEYTPASVKDNEGKEYLVFRDKNGNIVNNPANGLNPFTAQELLQSKLTDIIDTGKQQAGNGGGKTRPSIAVITGAKTQSQADDIITEKLMSEGLVCGTEEFTEKKSQIWSDNKISELPIQ